MARCTAFRGIFLGSITTMVKLFPANIESANYISKGAKPIYDRLIYERLFLLPVVDLLTMYDFFIDTRHSRVNFTFSVSFFSVQTLLMHFPIISNWKCQFSLAKFKCQRKLKFCETVFLIQSLFFSKFAAF